MRHFLSSGGRNVHRMQKADYLKSETDILKSGCLVSYIQIQTEAASYV